MKTEEEWLKIYHEAWKLFKIGHNRIRLKLGQFNDDDTWACLEVTAYGLDELEKILKLCRKYKLRIEFQGHYEFKIWEDYPQPDPQEEIKRIEKKKVRDRTEDEHFHLLKYKYDGSVRDYLLSMGEFKEDTQKE